MPDDEYLAERVRSKIGKKDRQKAWDHRDESVWRNRIHAGCNMVCGIIGERLMPRLGAEGAAAAMEEEMSCRWISPGGCSR